MSSDRKALLRGTSDTPSMRNWPLFAFLAGLVFFFYVFYIYQAQSTEFAMTRSELDDQIQKVRSLKMDVFNAKAENERLKASESSLKTELEKANKDKEECQANLRTCKLNTENLQSQVKKAEDDTGLKEQQTKDLQNSVDALKKEKEELATKVSAQETLAAQYKAELDKAQAEIQLLKAELAKAAPAPAGGAAPVAGGAAAAAGGAAVPAEKAAAPAISLGDILDRKQRNLDVQEQKAEKAEDVAAQQDQAQIPGNVAGNTEVKKIESLENKDNQQIPGPDSLVDKTNLDDKKVEEEKKDAPQVVAPPQNPGDRVKLAIAAADNDDDLNKPVVKGGDYDDKLDVEKGVGDDSVQQPAQ